jgi:hypothetical protein
MIDLHSLRIELEKLQDYCLTSYSRGACFAIEGATSPFVLRQLQEERYTMTSGCLLWAPGAKDL